MRDHSGGEGYVRGGVGSEAVQHLLTEVRGDNIADVYCGLLLRLLVLLLLPITLSPANILIPA